MSLATPTNELYSNLATVLGEQLTSVVYSPGAVIFQEGEREGHAYLIERGLVEVSRAFDGADATLGVLGPGELLGEMAPIDKQRRSATATAVQETEVLPISSRDLAKMIDQTHPFVHLLIRVLLNRLRATQQQALSGTIGGPCDMTDEPDHGFEVARGRALDRMKLEKALREALRKREFELNYQPIVSISERRIVGFEALIRWHSPDEGTISPFDFIGVAEDSGLIIPIGLWVVEHACHFLTRFQAVFAKLFPSHPPLFMSANVSGRQLENLPDVEDIGSVIRRVGVDPSTIKLEITEGVLMEKPEVAEAALQRLKSLGLTVAIDDFGTGYSSLSYLHKFQLDTLKIDRSFVNRILLDESSERIVQAIVGLARSLDMDIVAEGVESPEEAARLQEMGCDMAQGYLFSKPVTSERIMEMLEKPPAW